MKNKVIILIVLVIILIGIGVGYICIKNKDTDNNNTLTQNNTSESSNVKKDITQEEAVQILESKYGKKDAQTGNTMSYGYMATVRDKDGNKYYAYRHSWLVDNNHMSFLQNIFVSLDGETIKTTLTPDGYEDGDVVQF